MQTIRKALLNLSIAAVLLTAPLEAHAFTLLQAGVRGWPAGVVTYNYDLSNCVQPETQLLRTIDRAITLWNSVPTAHLRMKRGIKLTSVNPAVLMSNVSPGDAIIACSKNFEADTGRDPNTILAVGGAAVDDQGRIGFGYAILNADPTARFSTSDVTDDELAAVLAHEFGHSLGLGHSPDSSAIMYMEAVSYPSLAKDDVDGVTSLYKNPPEASDDSGRTLGCASVAAVGGRGGRGGGGRGGLGSNDFAGIRELALLFAMGYLLSRGTRRLREKITGRVALA
jgi:hypothetical protein